MIEFSYGVATLIGIAILLRLAVSAVLAALGGSNDQG